MLFQQSQSSTSWLQPVWGPQTCSQPEVITLHPRGRPYYRRRAQKSPQEEWGWPHHCLLTASPLFLLTLTPLMSNCLNLPFGTQGRSRTLTTFLYRQAMVNMERFLYLGGSCSFSDLARNAAAAAAKLRQSCPTLCNPIDSSPPGSPVPGILQARTLEWVAISFSNA